MIQLYYVMFYVRFMKVFEHNVSPTKIGREYTADKRTVLK